MDGTYEERYQAVYAAGVRYLTRREPDAEVHLRAFLEQQSARGRLIEFGCGEGFMASLAAELGYQVTAVDSAPSAIARARETHRHPDITFLCADVRELDALPSESFDVAIDLGCLHIITEDEAARRYLAHAFRLLRRGGCAYYQNLVPADDAEAWLPGKAQLAGSWRQRLAEAQATGSFIRSYEANGHSVEVELAVISSAKRPLIQQVALLGQAGFSVESARVVSPGLNSPFEAILISRKPD